MSQPVIHSSIASLVVALAVASLSVAGCESRDDRPQTPLSQLGTQPAAGGATEGAPIDSLNATARDALAKGNDAMRAKRPRDALAAYRQAAAASPHNAAPYFGIQMAARALGDSALADSAARRIRALSPASESPVDPHTLPPQHPETGKRP